MWNIFLVGILVAISFLLDYLFFTISGKSKTLDFTTTIISYILWFSFPLLSSIIVLRKDHKNQFYWFSFVIIFILVAFLMWFLSGIAVNFAISRDMQMGVLDIKP